MNTAHVLGAAVDPDQARDLARRILEDPRYGTTTTTTPSAPRRPPDLDRLPGEGIARFLTSPTTLVTLLVVVIAVTVWLSLHAARRRLPRTAGPRPEQDEHDTLGLDEPDALDAAAAAAEVAGDFATAIRLRFRAGLLRLGRAGRLSVTPATTNAQAARALRSPTFEDLARQFDAVAYGGAPAQRPDSERSRAQWQRLGQEART